MKLKIERLVKEEEISMCASMMAHSPPWSLLEFTTEQCQASLNESEIQLHGALNEEHGLTGFLAALAHGIAFEPLIEYVCVRHDLRGQGIGEKLIKDFEQRLYPNADNLYMFVSDINPDAARLYRRLGYQQVGALPDFNLPEQTEFLYRKTRRPKQSARSLRVVAREEHRW